MSVSKMCNGNIAPARFVSEDSSTAAGYVIAAASGAVPFGVSQHGVRNAPLASFDDGYAGIQNVNSIVVFVTNDECMIELSGTVTYGDFLKPGASGGTAITASANGDYYGAIAEESGVSGDLIRCRVTGPQMRGA